MSILSSKVKKWITLTAKVVGVFLFLLVLGFFSLRGYFLNKAISKVQTKLQDQYQTKLDIKEAGFTGLAGVNLVGISLVPDGQDTLLHLDQFSLSIKFGYALIGDIRVKNISLKEGYLQISKRNGIRNFDNFIKSNSDTLVIDNPDTIEEETAKEEVNYAEVLYKLITKILNKVPNDVSIENFVIKGIDEQLFVDFSIQHLSFKDGMLNSNLMVGSNQMNQHWQLSGMAYPSKRQADLQFVRLDSGRVMIPYLSERFNLLAGFGSARMQLKNIDFEGGELRIEGLASIQSLMVNHPKISKKDVVIDQVEFNYNYKIGQNYLSLDSSSKINFNGIIIHPFIKFQNAPDTVYYLMVQTENTEAQTFINALPEGLFSHIKGMEASGSFAYRLDFIYNENKPDEMVFESNLHKEQFRINKYGDANLAKLNGEFVYTPMENGRAMRPILVGEGNPNFTPINEISPYLRKCVLTCEDPSFYWHRGFVTEAFRQSIVKNIRTGKFKRGASTISMQLMKNVFLTRDKTMSRKLEEILLVYILENNYISSKDRMFEVYLNIIEWGPNIYGIGEASRFYFRKAPIDLTLSESMFLATIVPGPKHFMWRFGKDGVAKPYLERTYRYLATKMLVRELLLPEDTLGLNYQVLVSGPAKKYIIKSDSLVNDTLLEKELLLIQKPEDRDEE
ncbi:MAG: transglycosylase domain-containing protein [Bacteroidia bacterium]|nr:transglycosylase domain-containing protein [Bacteroidia bacterium]MCF8425891.1 transglycosylase domain-containing protein [Bacteroidia bacterium]